MINSLCGTVKMSFVSLRADPNDLNKYININGLGLM